MARLARAAGVAADDANDGAATQALVDRIAQICHRLKIPQRLSQLGVTAADVPALVRDVARQQHERQSARAVRRGADRHP